MLLDFQEILEEALVGVVNCQINIQRVKNAFSSDLIKLSFYNLLYSPIVMTTTSILSFGDDTLTYT